MRGRIVNGVLKNELVHRTEYPTRSMIFSTRLNDRDAGALGLAGDLEQAGSKTVRRNVDLRVEPVLSFDWQPGCESRGSRPNPNAATQSVIT